MAPTLTRTREDVLARALAEVGTWWPNPWWLNGRSTYNDCMAFVSWALYGLSGREPFYTFVPHIMERAIAEGRWAGVTNRDGRRAQVAATTDIQRGDVVVFDWRFIDSRDHVGIATGVIVRGHVIVIQTNNGGGGQGGGADSARVVSYPERFILGRYRPPYATADTAGGKPAPIPAPSTIPPEEPSMLPLIYFPDSSPQSHLLLIAPGKLKHIEGGGAAAKHSPWLAAVLTADDKWIEVRGPERMVALLDVHGVPRNALVVDGKGARVLNPETGEATAGGFWGWERLVLAETVRGIAEQAGQAGGLTAAIKALSTGGIDLAALEQIVEGAAAASVRDVLGSVTFRPDLGES